MPDDLASLARDLSALPRADRNAVLAALDPSERRLVEAAMRGAPLVRASDVPLHSTWFEGLFVSEDVTAAARAALAAAQPSMPAAEPVRVPGRTLMQAAGGLLAQASLRR